MTKGWRQDGIAMLLILATIGAMSYKMWLPDVFTGQPVPTLSLEDASERLERIAANSAANISRLDSRALDPAVYKAWASTMYDDGAANDLLYAADLVEQYNHDGNVERLQEAAEIVGDVSQRMSFRR
ncbi:hypothetical protein [Cohnella sp. JJ-181]|uniref:hypothetical protein n=1 Tax=Cohnella rhizoplanae TaxID=2974897 RepID=UPI0022FF4F9D|nr:hypothetical protein [Cohnella sp. JJ-181]CAI6083220.1 hypothetical protein COHCIP112018_03916 [Cohnella sp. JJ-181]